MARQIRFHAPMQTYIFCPKISVLKNTQVTLLGSLSNYWALCSFLFSSKHLQEAHHTLSLLLILVVEPSQFLPSQQ